MPDLNKKLTSLKRNQPTLREDHQRTDKIKVGLIKDVTNLRQEVQNDLDTIDQMIDKIEKNLKTYINCIKQKNLST